MRRKTTVFITAISLFAAIITLSLATSHAGGYRSLAGVKSVDIVIDFQTKSPKLGLVKLKLLHDMYKDKALRAIDPKLDMVIVVIGSAVKLASTAREGFTGQQAQLMDKIKQQISTMAKDGVRFEICMVAAHMLGVKAASLYPEITQVNNGWISLVGYQSKGYNLVPVY